MLKNTAKILNFRNFLSKNFSQIQNFKKIITKKSKKTVNIAVIQKPKFYKF